jgi:hypothetical protein
MRVAVSGKQTARRECSGCQSVVQILPSGIAVDVHHHTLTRGGSEHRFPVSRETGAWSGYATAWVGYDMQLRIANRCDKPV